MPQSFSFNQALLQRYGITGPRYTSYPTAAEFHEKFTENDYRDAIEESNGDLVPSPLSLYIHLPFCSSPCFYCACTRIITRQTDVAENYLHYLQRELTLLSHLFDSDRVIDQVHFGGGTPTFYDCNQLGWLLRQISANFNVRPGDIPELAIEIDPRTVSPDDIRNLIATGFGRMSFGIQDFDTNVQHEVNRCQSVERVLELMHTARACGVRSINVDLIYGLPKQTPDSFSATLDTIIEAGPDRIAAYGYAHMPHLFPSQRRLQLNDLPDAGMRLEMFQLAISKLTGAGYVYIGMDHFALPTDDLAVARRHGWLNRNFQGYSARPECDLVGLGMSAVSMIGGSYSQNYKTLDQYYASLAHGDLPVWRGVRLSDDDHIRGDIIQAIMCHGHVRFDDIANRYRIDFHAYFSRELKRLQQLETEGLLQLGPEELRVTSMGRLLLRVIAMTFDAYLAPVHEAQGRYSSLI
jgi:oxygen-independent coproporphyrinogen III oxidase